MNKHDGRLSSVVFSLRWNNIKKATLQPECHEFIRRYLQFRGQITKDAPGVGLHCGSQKVTFYRIFVDYVVQWKEVWTIYFKVRPMFLENINTHWNSLDKAHFPPEASLLVFSLTMFHIHNRKKKNIYLLYDDRRERQWIQFVGKWEWSNGLRPERSSKKKL